MKRPWLARGIIFTFIFLCLFASAVFESDTPNAISSSCLDPTINYKSSILPDTAPNCSSTINRVRYSKSSAGANPTFETLSLASISNYFHNYCHSTTATVRLVGGTCKGSFKQLCRMTDIPPPFITA